MSNASVLFKTFYYDARRFDLNEFGFNLVCQLLEYYHTVEYKIVQQIEGITDNPMHLRSRHFPSANKTPSGKRNA